MTDFVLLSAQKPPEGTPCNGCGECCQTQACGLSSDYLKSDASPCIALEWDGARYRCGLAVRPSHYLKIPNFADEMISGMIIQALGIGKGCCSGSPHMTAGFTEGR